jgi:excisionase family DNA binding protein
MTVRDGWLTTSEAARLLGVSSSRAGQLRREGRLGAAVRMSSGYLVERQAVEQFRAQKKEADDVDHENDLDTADAGAT